MNQVVVTGAPAPAGQPVKVIAKTGSGTSGPPGPAGPAGPAGAPGAPGGQLVNRAVAEGDALPDPGSEKLAWSTVTNSLVMYSQGRWRAVSPGISVGNTAPPNPVLNQIWVDTN